MDDFFYLSENKKFGVKLTRTLFNEIIAKCKMSGRNETGGVLIGYYSIDHIWAIVTLATGPSSDSKHSRCSFYRGVNRLIELLDHKWENSNEYYIGEWHFHPHSSSCPSDIDIKQMLRLSNDSDLKCPQPILLIVGGSEDQGWSIDINIFAGNVIIKLNETSKFEMENT